MDTAASIKKAVQVTGRYLARLPSRSAARTIKALTDDGYGARLSCKTLDGYELWLVVGEPFDEPSSN